MGGVLSEEAFREATGFVEGAGRRLAVHAPGGETARRKEVVRAVPGRVPGGEAPGDLRDDVAPACEEPRAPARVVVVPERARDAARLRQERRAAPHFGSRGDGRGESSPETLSGTCWEGCVRSAQTYGTRSASDVSA